MSQVIGTQNSNLVFLGARKWSKTPTSNLLTFIKIGCSDTFQQFEYLAHKDCPVDFADKQPVVPTFTLGNYDGRASFQLTNLQAKQK